MRIHTSETYLGLKAATRALLRLLGRQEQAAEQLGTAQSTISDWGSPNRTDRFIPLDKLLDLETEAGEPLITRELARQQNFALFPLPRVKGDGIWVNRLGALAKEAGEAVSAIAQAVGDDGDVTPDEIGKYNLIAEVDQALEALAGVRAALVEVERGEAS